MGRVTRLAKQRIAAAAAGLDLLCNHSPPSPPPPPPPPSNPQNDQCQLAIGSFFLTFFCKLAPPYPKGRSSSHRVIGRRS